MSDMHSDLHVAALERFVADCSAGGHALCGGDGACAAVHERAVEIHRREWEWSDVDLGRDVLIRAGTPPDSTWKTATLLRFVRDKVLTPPWRDPLRRSVFVTAALGLLGERGISADLILREFLAPAVATQLLNDLSLVVWEREHGSDEVSPLAPTMQPWLHYVSDCLETCRAESGEVTLDLLMHETRKGVGRLRIDNWIDSAAAAHLIAWKLEGYGRTEVVLDYRVLPGGHSVSRWVYERFTRTSPREWCTRSIELEIAWAHDSDDMAVIAGISSDVLAERSFPMSVLSEALGRSVIDELPGGLIESSVVERMLEDIILAVQAGDRFAAVHRARKAWLDDPRNAVWRNALAFCSIPDDPELSIRLLISTANEVENVNRAVNLASAHIVLGELDRAEEIFGDITGTVAAWYWDPTSLISGNPVAVEIEPVCWREAAEKVLRSTSEDLGSPG